jgi:hypothetical protein
MRFASLVVFLVCAWWSTLGAAQDDAEVEKIGDTMVRLCLGGGRSEAVSGGGSGGANLSLRSLDVKGNVKGEFKINQIESRGPGEWHRQRPQPAGGRSGRQGACLPETGSGAVIGCHAPAKEAGRNGPVDNGTGRRRRRKRCKKFAGHDQ